MYFLALNVFLGIFCYFLLIWGVIWVFFGYFLMLFITFLLFLVLLNCQRIWGWKLLEIAGRDGNGWKFVLNMTRLVIKLLSGTIRLSNLSQIVRL